MDPAVALIGSTLNATSLLSPRAAGRGAFEIFLRPGRRGRVRPAEREVHERAVTEELTVHGKRVVAYRWGDGARPVLLLHGWQSRASRYAALVPRLRALGLTPVSFDAPGHGDSGGRTTTILEYREAIRRMQDRYGTFDSVVAHSFGVTCAFLALREGARAGRLVAVAGVSEFGYLPARFSAGLGLHPRVERELRRRIEQELFAGTDDVWEHFDAAHDPAAVPLPILAVHDEGDAVARIGQAHRLKAAYGDRLELLTTRGLGHSRILAAPAVIDNIVGFLGEAPAAGGAGGRPGVRAGAGSGAATGAAAG
ncbi:alpha/beta hydrolase [Kitasatospora indigofera]|uniref:Alpha/beta hydrolase n=1 Tax=Kitasatospora indigofera TaxID=67307 RepID=A0A919KKN5_9ACTN|nr:alpha/beta hydrolase [Kitasatospora indigofera]GHH60297.1 alpha/beta hydrolase [Kitasatospora indigofera]